jgi:extracellular factor (EF) 3-hydroxypalmitic acid methyl ester biosynthesis protein
MSVVQNGNGNGSNGHVRHATKKAAPPASGEAGSLVSFQTTEGIKLRGTLSRTTRHMAIFELYSPAVTPRFSEAFSEFTIVMQSRQVYSGRAVISKILDAGTKIICEVMLDVMDWQDLNSVLALHQEGQITKEFKIFLNEWQKNYKVSPEFKVAIADMQTFFHDLQLLFNRTELKLQAWPLTERQVAELKMLHEVEKVVLPLIDFLFEKFEELAKRIEGDQKAFHMQYMRQHLQPLLLCAPFANRTFSKPRGYAGDYEMVNMIGRNGFEGNSLFAKMVHRWFVQQPPAEAHRNRVQYLAERIDKEVGRIFPMHRIARIFNFACGPAIEVQKFVQSSILADHAEFTLADFDDETLGYGQKLINQLIAKRGLDTLVRFEKKSVHQLIKDRQKLARQTPYDFVYCAGLFDYLPHNTCKQLMENFYEFVAPGGLLLATNVSPTNPLRYGMEHLLDWHLIYRNEREMRALSPSLARDEDIRIHSDSTGVNLFLEIRKPKDA